MDHILSTVRDILELTGNMDFHFTVIFRFSVCEHVYTSFCFLFRISAIHAM